MKNGEEYKPRMEISRMTRALPQLHVVYKPAVFVKTAFKDDMGVTVSSIHLR